MRSPAAKDSRSLSARLADIAPFFVGYGCLDAWGQMTSASVLTSSPAFEQLVKYVSALLPPLVLLLLAFRLAPLVRRRHREAVYLFGFAGTLGTFALYLILGGSLDAEWLPCANVLISVARCFLLVCWWERLTTLRIGDMWAALGCAVVLGALVNLGAELIPANAEYVLFGALPLVSTVFLQIRHREGADADAADGTGKRGSRDVSRAPMPTARQALTAVPLMLIIVLGLANIPSEALVVMEHSAGYGDVGTVAVVMQTFRRMAVNLAALGLAYLAVRVNITATFYVAIPAIMLAAFFLALGFDSSVGVLHSVSRTGSEMIRYIIVYLLFRIALQGRVPALFCYSLMVLFHCAGTLAGLCVALALGSDGMLMALVFMVVLVVAMLLVVGAQQRGEFALAPTLSPGAASPAEDGAASEASTPADRVSQPAPDREELLAAFAAHHGLTQREGEVMELWVKGHTTAFIEEQLCVSKYTVKTHVNHIYEKTGTNSKEGLIVLFDRFCKGQ